MASNALAASSQDTYNNAIKQFETFLRDNPELRIYKDGISDYHLGCYVAYLYQRNTINSYKKIEDYISSGVRPWHLRKGIDWRPLTERPSVRDVMAGAKRLLAPTTGSARKLPVTIFMMRQMRSLLQSTPKDRSIWAAMALAFNCVLRCANAMTPAAGNPKYGQPASTSAVPGMRLPPPKLPSVMRRCDVELVVGTGQPPMAWVSLYATKTIQDGSRILRVPVVPYPAVSADICPFCALLVYLTETPHTARRPRTEELFGWTTPTGWVKLSKPAFVARVKELLQQLGYDPSKLGGHSFRRGGATFAFGTAHLSAQHIMALGDWLSATFIDYCAIQDNLRLEGAQAMAAAAACAR